MDLRASPSAGITLAAGQSLPQATSVRKEFELWAASAINLWFLFLACGDVVRCAAPVLGVWPTAPERAGLCPIAPERPCVAALPEPASGNKYGNPVRSRNTGDPATRPKLITDTAMSSKILRDNRVRASAAPAGARVSRAGPSRARAGSYKAWTGHTGITRTDNSKKHHGNGEQPWEADAGQPTSTRPRRGCAATRAPSPTTTREHETYTRPWTRSA